MPLLTANAYRREEIKQLGGVDEVIFGHFDERMQHMDWRDFIHKLLIGQFHAGWIISGRNNRFGYKGQGNAEGMAVECAKVGIGVLIVAISPLSLRGVWERICSLSSPSFCPDLRVK